MKSFLTPSRGGGFVLLVVGLILVLIVFSKALSEYQNVKVEVQGAENIMEAITQSSGLLIELLFKIAYLGLALAAGAVLIKYSIPLMREERLARVAQAEEGGGS